MKALFSIVSLLVVLAVVGVLVSKQFKATRPAGPVGQTSNMVGGQPQQIQDQVRSDMARAFEQAASRENIDR